MKVPRFVKTVSKTFFDVPTWLGTKQIATTTSAAYNLARNVFKKSEATRQETFEQAMERLHLTEAELIRRVHEFKRLFIIFLLLSLLIFAYSLYSIKDGFHIHVLVGIVLTLYTLGQAFRFHFWIFQIKQRKLGCTLKDWVNGTFRGIKK